MQMLTTVVDLPLSFIDQLRRKIFDALAEIFTKEYMENDPFIKNNMVSQLTIKLETLYEVC